MHEHMHVHITVTVMTTQPPSTHTQDPIRIIQTQLNKAELTVQSRADMNSHNSMLLFRSKQLQITVQFCKKRNMSTVILVTSIDAALVPPYLVSGS